MAKRLLIIGSSGYVGSYLTQTLTASGHSVTGVDRRPSQFTDFACAFQTLDTSFYKAFDGILHFAGVSSVSAAQSDPAMTMRENLGDLITLACSLEPEQRLIYASSASVYSDLSSRCDQTTLRDSLETDSLPPPTNAYDASKASLDHALTFGFPEQQTVGLRMGTVSGVTALTKNMRNELVLNAMVQSAVQKHHISLRNPDAGRALVCLQDLALYVEHLVNASALSPRILNVASFNTTIGEIARTVSEFTGAPIHLFNQTETYSFRMNCDLLASICPSVMRSSLSDQIEQLSIFYGQHAS